MLDKLEQKVLDKAQIKKNWCVRFYEKDMKLIKQEFGTIQMFIDSQVLKLRKKVDKLKN